MAFSIEWKDFDQLIVVTDNISSQWLLLGVELSCSSRQKYMSRGT